MCGTAYAYDGAQLGADGALKIGEHGVDLLALHRDDEVGEDVRVLLFGVCDKARNRFFIIDYTDCWPKHNRYNRLLARSYTICDTDIDTDTDIIVSLKSTIDITD